MNRSWCAQAQYKDHKPFYFGTIVIDVHAKDHEVRAALTNFWYKHNPFPIPPFEPIPGSIFFKAE